jgi:hypothetical protein
MAVETTKGSWASRAESAIKTLRDVDGVSIQADGEDITELHVLTTSKRPPKQIVRDVQTLLLTKFNRQIDRRVVSVAYAHKEPTGFEPDIEPAAAAEAQEPREAPAAERDRDRIRFAGVNLYVSEGRVTAQVELKWKGIPRMGSASGVSTRDGAHKLVVAATVAAVQEYLEDELALGVDDAHVARVGGKEVVMVSLVLHAHRTQKTLVGCCTVEQDAPQATALATLSALNRVVGGLRTKEPTEYVLRPTSA